MDFKTAVTTCLKLKYMDFTGRAARSEYWYYTLFAVIVGVVASIIDTALGFQVGVVGLILNVALLRCFLVWALASAVCMTATGLAGGCWSRWSRSSAPSC